MKRPINLIKIKSIYELRNGQILAQIIAKRTFFIVKNSQQLIIDTISQIRTKCLEIGSKFERLRTKTIGFDFNYNFKINFESNE
jgi:hypothetical protein